MVNENARYTKPESSQNPRLLRFIELAAFVSFILFNETGPPIVKFPAPLFLIVFLFVISLFAVFVENRKFFRVWSKEPVVFFIGFIAINIVSVFFSERPVIASVHVGSYCIIFLFVTVLIQHHNLDSLLNLTKWSVFLIIFFSVCLHLAGIYNGFKEFGDRFAGSFFHPNQLAMFCGIYVLLSITTSLLISDDDTKSTRLSLFLKYVEIVLLLPVFWVLVKTRCRAEPIALFVTLFILLGLTLSKEKHAQAYRIRSVILAFLGMCIMGISLFAFYLRSKSAPLWSLSGRGEVWGLVVTKILDYPMLGYGTGVIRDVMKEQGDKWFFNGSHNSYFDAALYAGLPGGFVLVLFMASTIYKVGKKYSTNEPVALARVAICAYYAILSFVDLVITGWPRLDLLLFLMIGFHIARTNTRTKLQQSLSKNPVSRKLY